MIEIIGLEFIACGINSIIRNGKFTLQDSVLISENESSTVLVLNETAAANIINCSFEGAAVSIVRQSFVTINDISISDNRANVAALTVYDSQVVFNGSIIFMNNQGGGTLLTYNSTVQLMGSTIFSNCSNLNNDPYLTVPFVAGGGGAISSYLSHLTFQGYTTFTNNRAKYGGAICAIESVILFTTNSSHPSESNSTVSDLGTVLNNVQNNVATKNGGGIYLYRSTMVVRNADYQIIANNAYKKGGGIFLVYSDIKIEVKDEKAASLILARNRAQFGGGFYLEGSSRLQMHITNVSIRLIGNSADFGAAIFVDDNTKYSTCLATAVGSTPESECFFRIHNSDII
ncbi:MAG: hypothetical protein MJE68_25595, partial [Proteobacteria bacterium]|nr:hypothetical protein [Pseudomonadota bacterium]